MNNTNLHQRAVLFFTALSFIIPTIAESHSTGTPGSIFLQVEVKDKFQRTALANLGMSVDAVRSDSVYGTATFQSVEKIRDSGFRIIEKYNLTDAQNIFDFPTEDTRFHNYQELTQELDNLVRDNPKILRKFSIGKTIQGRDIWGVQINSNVAKFEGQSAVIDVKPGIVFMGNHHAREHVSAEIPLMLIQYLVKSYATDKEITRLIDTRDIYIIPMVNPDGVEHDIAKGNYKWHRKNMRKNSDGSLGVDLNRNYGFHWNTGGSSSDPSDETYHGTAAFSEPETQAIKNFVESKPNLKVLLSYHTFSELILYPWGHKDAGVEKLEDRTTFEAMAKKMATWNSYKPEQSSDLYIASGDTVDWAYGTLGIFSFTFELSPKDMWSGGFYPGATALDRIFQDNLKPALYLIELANDPHRSKNKNDAGLSWLN